MAERAKTPDSVSSGWRTQAAVIGLLGVLAVVLILSGLDARVAGYAQALAGGNPALLRTARLLSDWGNYLFYAFFAGTLLLGLIRGERRLVAVSLAYWLTLLLASVLLTRALKICVGRPRPCYPGGLTPLSLNPYLNSFPSGHTSDAFSALIPLWRLTANGFLRGAGLGLACLIGTSRVLLSAHYPSDVLVGAALGLGVGMAVTSLVVRAERGRDCPAMAPSPRPVDLEPR